MMTHPNENCCWDQRIPNEPLLERQFLVERPPIIPQDRPGNTSQCTPAEHLKRPWLLMDRTAEKQSMMYWHHNTVNTDIKGTNTASLTSKSLNTMTEKHPGRPWLHGIHRNVDRDSHLRNHNHYNPMDCVVPAVQQDLSSFNRIADEAMLKEMTQTQLFRNGALEDGRMWNQPTSMRMTEPVDFDYQKFIQKGLNKRR
jgi:hypothetical protein